MLTQKETAELKRLNKKILFCAGKKATRKEIMRAFDLQRKKSFS
jgi:hypothetical protein